MIKYIYLFIIVLLIPGWTQSETELEKQLEQTELRLERERSKLDSLKINLEEFSKKIDQAKAKEQPKESQLADWLNQAQNKSVELEEQKAVVNRLENQQTEIRKELDSRYTDTIDSLRNVLNSDISTETENRIEREILHYTEKRLSVAPSPAGLSFDPAKLQQIQPAQAGDTMEYAIYMSYLKDAKRNLSRQLKRIRQITDEVKDIHSLQTKTQEFVEEVSEDRPFGVVTQTGLSQSSPSNFQTNDNERIGTAALRTGLHHQVQSLFLFMNQLKELESTSEIGTRISPMDSSKISISYEAYIKLLEQTEKLLTQYLEVIDNKLNYNPSN